MTVLWPDLQSLHDINTFSCTHACTTKHASSDIIFNGSNSATGMCFARDKGTDLEDVG